MPRSVPGIGDNPADSPTVQPETLLPLSQLPGPPSPSRPWKGRRAQNPPGSLKARGEHGVAPQLVGCHHGRGVGGRP